jgi:hypothetical protein
LFAHKLTGKHQCDPACFEEFLFAARERKVRSELPKPICTKCSRICHNFLNQYADVVLHHRFPAIPFTDANFKVVSHFSRRESHFPQGPLPDDLGWYFSPLAHDTSFGFREVVDTWAHGI